MGTWCSRGACLIRRNVTVEAQPEPGPSVSQLGSWFDRFLDQLVRPFLTNWSDLGLEGYISIKTQEEWIENTQGVTSLIELK